MRVYLCLLYTGLTCMWLYAYSTRITLHYYFNKSLICYICMLLGMLRKSHFIVVQIWDSLATTFLHHRECNFRTGTKDTEFKSSHFNLAHFISSVVSSSYFYYTSLVINLLEFAMSSQTLPYHKQQVLHPLPICWLLPSGSTK